MTAVNQPHFCFIANDDNDVNTELETCKYFFIKHAISVMIFNIILVKLHSQKK